MSARTRRIAAAALLLLGLALRLKISASWAFVSSDGVCMMRLAEQLQAHHHYAIAPPPVEGYVARPPFYPAFLALVRGDGSRDPTWHGLVVVQALLDVFVLAPLVMLLARQLARRSGANDKVIDIAGLSALALTLFTPITLFFFAAALTELWAMVLTTAAIWIVLRDAARPRLQAFAGGLVTGIACLLRQDSLLLLPAIAIAAAMPPATAAPRLRSLALRVACVAAGFTIAYGPWLLRNVAVSGAAHPLGERTYRTCAPLPAWKGYHRWVSTWAERSYNAAVEHCFFEPKCEDHISRYPAHAFASDEERAQVTKLLSERRDPAQEPAIIDAFDRLAEVRERAHPLRSFLWLPAQRAYRLWVSRHGDLVQDVDWQPWPAFTDKARATMLIWSKALFGFVVAALALGLARPRTRRATLVLACALVGRSAALGYTNNVEPRYVTEVLPVAYALVAAGLAVGISTFAARRRARSSSPPTPSASG